MKGMDPRYRIFANCLNEAAPKSDSDKIQTSRDTVQIMWPDCEFEDILKDSQFYKRPVASIPTLTEEEYMDSLKSKNVPKEVIDSLALVNVDYRGFNNQTYHGQIIVHKDLVESTKHIFKRILKETDFPIVSLIPLSFFNWDSSLNYNNSGCFDWRLADNSYEISDHAFGAAIDINPLINPWIKKGEVNRPYDPKLRGTLHSKSKVVEIFKEEGWKWGGDWKDSQDLQHFYRPDIALKHYGKVEANE